MRSLRTFLTLALLLFLTLAGLHGLHSAATAQTTFDPAAESCTTHIFASGSQTGGKRITLRVKIGAPAGPGGATVYIASNSAAVPVPASVLIPEGQRELIFQVTTNPVAVDEYVQVMASVARCGSSKTVLIKAPVLRSLAVQSVMASEGLGRVTVCLSGRAAVPVWVNLTSSNPAVIPASSIQITAGKGCVVHRQPTGAVQGAVSVTITVESGEIALSAPTTVKFYPVFTTQD